MSAGIGQAVGKVVANVAVDAAQAAGDAAVTQAKLTATEMASSSVVRRGLRTGKEALSLASKSIAFSLTAITTLAAGYLAGMGIDFIPFVDKYSIISSILLYTSIVAALVSPLLVVPRTALAVRDHRREALRAQLGQLDSQRTEIEAQREKNIATARDIKARLKADSATAQGRAWWEHLPLFGKSAPVPRPKGEIERDSAEKARLQNAIDEDDAKAKAVLGETQQVQQELSRMNSSRWASRLRVLCYSFYAIISAAIFLSVLPAVAAVYATVAMIVLYILAKRTSFAVVAPVVSVHLLAFGLLLGLETYNLPANANLRMGDDDYPVRVLMTTSTGYVAIGALAKKDADRQLSFVPRESVTRISALRPPILADWYRRLPKFSFLELAGAQSK